MGLLTSIPNNVLTSLLNYFKSRYQPKFDDTNVATGVASATLNTQSGVVTFTDNCALAPSWSEYVINNSLITPISIVNIMVTNNGGGLAFTSLVQWICSEGSMTISINDGFNGAAAAPIVAFEILN
jgi:hypothetical protein